MVFADERLYLFSERGTVAIAEANPAAYKEHGRFQLIDRIQPDVEPPGRRQRQALPEGPGHDLRLRRPGKIGSGPKKSHNWFLRPVDPPLDIGGGWTPHPAAGGSAAAIVATGPPRGTPRTDQLQRTEQVLADTRLKIAVFIDFDNIEIGVKNTLNTQFDIGVVLEALRERGDVVSKIAYSDWSRGGDYSRALTQHATKLVQRNLTPGGDKNGADINLALDALEMAFTHPHINAYVIVGGDSDFITLVEKLKQYDKQIFVVGGRSFTSYVMQRNCHEFIAYENLISGGRRSGGDRGGRQPGQASSAQAPIEQVVPLVRRALKILSDREVSPQLGLLKSTLLQLDSTFSERTYGVSSFRDFADKLAAAGHVTVREMGRNVVVELTAAGEAAGQAAPPPRRRDPRRTPAAPRRGPAARAEPRRWQPRRPGRGGRGDGEDAGAGAAHRRSGGRDPAAVPGGAEPAALADVCAPGEAVHAQRRLDVRRAEVRLQQHHGSLPRRAARGALPDRARSPGRDAPVPGERDADAGRGRHDGRRSR